MGNIDETPEEKARAMFLKYARKQESDHSKKKTKRRPKNRMYDSVRRLAESGKT